MILQNLSRAIREQNYYAVALEFVIVIAGVVIGFQINAWAEDRAQRAEERVILANLRDDFLWILNDPDIVRRAELTAQAPEDLRWLIAAIRSGEEPDDADRIQLGIRASIQQYAPTPASPTFEELQSSGRLSLIRNPAVRQALTRFAEFNEIEWAVAVDTLSRINQAPVLGHVQFDFARDNYVASAAYDWAGLTTCHAYMQGRIMDLDLLADWNLQSRDQAAVTLALLEEELSG